MTNKLKMVLGFMFNEKETDVLLIEKQKPQWQIGKLNGIGGKLEKGEYFYQAMIREFREETGIEHTQWREIILMYGDDWEVQVFTAKSNDVFHYKQTEEEKVILIPINDLDNYDHVSNLQWLIPMCLDKINYKISNL